VQCHACGGWFRSLANHVWRAHGLSADAYRALYGLRARTGLVGPALREARRQHAREHLRPYWDRASALAAAQGFAERSARRRGRTWPLEARRDPRTTRTGAANAARLRTWTLEQQAAGRWRRPQPRDPAEALARARARWRQLIADPAYRAAFARRMSEAKGGRVLVACATCGRRFELRPSVAAAGRRRFCGRRCYRVFLRWHLRSVGARGRSKAPAYGSD
jgi:hypothetical protein